jgi:ATP phosphoribosyltransferase
MAKGSKGVELLSSITGKGTTMTARSLASVSTTLENKIRRLERKKELTAEQKKELTALKKQLKDVDNEMAAEASKAGRSSQQTARDRKMKDKVTLPEIPFNKGGYANCGASMKPTQKSTNMMRGGMVRK